MPLVIDRAHLIQTIPTMSHLQAKEASSRPKNDPKLTRVGRRSCRMGDYNY